jgi:hypothetical protein
MVGSQASVPASLTARQSAFVLHSTQTPARVELFVSPHTDALGSIAEVQGVPVGAGS